MRAIDGDHLKRWIIARWGETDPTSDRPLTAREILDQIDREMEFPNADRPTDDMVEVVRCKDCKWFVSYTMENKTYKMCRKAHLGSDDFFCADGEVKSDG